MMGEVGIGITPATLPPITQVGVVYCRVSNFLLVLLKKMFMARIEVNIGLRTSTVTPTAQLGMVDFRVALLLQVPMKKMFMVMRGLI